MRLILCLAVSAVAGLSTPTLANDGFGGLSATGLTFGQTDAVAIEEERLFIGIDRISVEYVFRNLTDQDVTGEVIFPMPPIPVWRESDWNLPADLDRENLVGFKAVVDGREVAVTVDRIAVIQPEWQEGRPLSFQYDTPGSDVTADLARLGIPLTLDDAKVIAALNALTPEQQGEATALGLASFEDGYTYGTWSVILRYHWTQTFPANTVVKISHEYENRSGGGLFGWTEPPEEYMQSYVDQYCIDSGTSKALAKALKNPEGDEFGNYGTAYNISYVLRTANSWAGPIGKFTLTLDKGDPGNVVSLCAEGVKKTGPTTFVVEKTNYSPDRDLEVLIVQPMLKE